MSSLRIGYGEDIHRLQEGGRFVLAGTEITTAFSPVAHSDGDCYYHALADAILGAIGEEDIGHHFPPEEKKTEKKPVLRSLISIRTSCSSARKSAPSSSR